MKKKSIILTVIVFVVSILVVVITHYLPLWVSVLSVLSVISGVYVGWLGKSLYDQYIRETPEEFYIDEEEL